MSPRKKADPPPDEVPEVPEFIVTFADMVTLLVTFFILLLTFSTPVDDAQRLVEGSLIGAEGIFPFDKQADALKASRSIELERTLRGVAIPLPEHIDDLEEDAEALIRKVPDAQLELTRVREGIRIRIPGDVLFRASSAQLESGASRVLRQLCDAIRLRPHVEAIVEGHTDAGFEPTVSFRTPDDIAMARAQTVARYLIEEGRVGRSKVATSSFGDRLPRAENDTATGRKKNRRVEILLRASE